MRSRTSRAGSERIVIIVNWGASVRGEDAGVVGN